MKLVPLNSIFDITYGNQFDLSKMSFAEYRDTGINFISRATKNFGIVGRVLNNKSTEPFPAGLITVTLGGSYLLASFIQPEKFYTAQNIKVLTPKSEMTFNEKLFYCICIQKNRYRYSSHGREANVSLDTILVPEILPDVFHKFSLDSIIKDISKPIEKEPYRLDVQNWKYFVLSDLFEITGSKTTPLKKLKELGEGEYPYVTTQATNNGVSGFYNFYTESGNILTIDSAVAGFCSYQKNKFSASDHVEKLIPKFNLNKYVAVFLTLILNKEQYRYNYGRKAAQMRLKIAKIKLPSKNGNPDFEYMENFIKSLPYSSSI